MRVPIRERVSTFNIVKTKTFVPISQSRSSVGWSRCLGLTTHPSSSPSILCFFFSGYPAQRRPRQDRAEKKQGKGEKRPRTNGSVDRPTDRPRGFQYLAGFFQQSSRHVTLRDNFTHPSLFFFQPTPYYSSSSSTSSSPPPIASFLPTDALAFIPSS